jgi:hypothetical protein
MKKIYFQLGMFLFLTCFAAQAAGYNCSVSYAQSYDSAERKVLANGDTLFSSFMHTLDFFVDAESLDEIQSCWQKVSFQAEEACNSKPFSLEVPKKVITYFSIHAPTGPEIIAKVEGTCSPGPNFRIEGGLFIEGVVLENLTFSIFNQ